MTFNGKCAVAKTLTCYHSFVSNLPKPFAIGFSHRNHKHCLLYQTIIAPTPRAPTHRAPTQTHHATNVPSKPTYMTTQPSALHNPPFLPYPTFLPRSTSRTSFPFLPLAYISIPTTLRITPTKSSHLIILKSAPLFLLPLITSTLTSPAARKILTYA